MRRYLFLRFELPDGLEQRPVEGGLFVDTQRADGLRQKVRPLQRTFGRCAATRSQTKRERTTIADGPALFDKTLLSSVLTESLVVAAVNAVSRAISPSRIGPLCCINRTRISPWVGVSPAPSAHSHAWLRIAVLSRSRP